MQEPEAAPGAGDFFLQLQPTADTGRDHECSQGCGSLEEGEVLWDAAQAQVVRGQVQEGKVAALSSPLWTTDSCGHSALTLFNPLCSVSAAQQPVLTDALLNLSRSYNAEGEAPCVSDTRAPLTSVGGDGGGTSRGCPDGPGSGCQSSLSQMWATGEAGGGDWRGLAPTQQSCITLSPTPGEDRGGESGCGHSVCHALERRPGAVSESMAGPL